LDIILESDYSSKYESYDIINEPDEFFNFLEDVAGKTILLKFKKD
jgi:hypothetical protein